MSHHIRMAFYKRVNVILQYFGFSLIRANQLTDRQKSGWAMYSHNAVKLPEGADDYLRHNNKRLVELTSLYSSLDSAVITPSLWTKNRTQDIDLKYFRGDNPYIYQFKDGNFETAYAITTYYIKAMDSLNLLEKLKEDSEFGLYTFKVDNKVVSRDLLDSILEIYFLEKHLRISKLSHINLLDIGAGYGRLAHRMVEALPNIDNYFCTDAVPISTFISEYYLRFRNIHNKAKVVPLHKVQEVISNHSIDIAVNINSFPECSTAAIDWWLRILGKYKVRYLMVVCNSQDGRLLTSQKEDILPIIERNGYCMLTKEPTYGDPIVQQYGVSPKYHFLFEWSSTKS
jgi:putative sugar O-methyltransferase